MQLIAYCRVSTKGQQESGLGLAAQKSAVAAYARSSGARIVATFTETESGKKVARPQLAAAIDACRKSGATLVVAKLDRLARNVAFTAALMDSGVEFVCCDNPNANKLTIHILAAIAQSEAEAISARTKAALAELKAQGVALGNPNARTAVRSARQANSEAAKRHAAEVLPIAQRKRRAGWTLEQIADFLTGRGLRTRRGNAWSAPAVLRLLAT